MIEDGMEDHDSVSTELDEGGNSVGTDRSLSCTSPTTVASSDAK